jgi:hypothetical protein
MSYHRDAGAFCERDIVVHRQQEEKRITFRQTGDSELIGRLPDQDYDCDRVP